MTYRTEFPDFDPATLPAIPEGYDDASWGIEACPSFTNADLGLTIWVDYADASVREHPEGPRFGIYACDGDGARIDDGFEFDSDDWQAILDQIARVRCGLGAEWSLTGTGGGLRMWKRDLQDGRVAYIGDAEGGTLTDAVEPCEFSIWQGDDELGCTTANNSAEALAMIDSLAAAPN